MKQITIVLVIFFSMTNGFAQSPVTPAKILYGHIQKADLSEPSFREWFEPAYKAYEPNIQAVQRLEKIAGDDIRIQVFLGTWCGDSRREVPRLLKILETIKFPAGRLQMIGLGASDSLYKQSPTHEEAGKGIFRVPTIVVYKDKTEINRINEYPCLTIEQDLLTIIEGRAYQPNYKTFSFVRQWMEEGSLRDKNISARSLAGHLRFLPEGEFELNSIAQLLLKQGAKQEALKLFQVNQQLYPESARAVAGVGEGYYRMGEPGNAATNLERALELNKDPKMVREILAMLYEVKGVR